MPQLCFFKLFASLGTDREVGCSVNIPNVQVKKNKSYRLVIIGDRLVGLFDRLKLYKFLKIVLIKLVDRFFAFGCGHVNDLVAAGRGRNVDIFGVFRHLHCGSVAVLVLIGQLIAVLGKVSEGGFWCS